MNVTDHEEKLYPLPNIVCAYGSREEFEQFSRYSATDSGQWVHWQERVEHALEGQHARTLPLLVEFLTTLNCNFCCPTCSRRMLREKWSDVSTWGENPITPTTMMALEDMIRALDVFSKYQIPGIIWGGGDPTLNPDTYAAMRYAKSKGLQSSFLTNGSLFTAASIEELLDVEPVLIRVSLNCGSAEVHRRFHAYPRGKPYFEQTVEGIRQIARKKLEAKSSTLFGISVILDERNLADTLLLADLLRQIVDETGPGAIDFALFRTVYDYYGNYSEMDSSTYEKASIVLGEGGAVRQRFEDLGVAVVIPKTDSLEPIAKSVVTPSADCLAYGWCTELHPNGDIFLCSERYGNPDYRIGNIFQEDLMDIWTGQKRMEVLRWANETHCYASRCPHQSRGHHLNRIFHQIEKKRAAGMIDEVRVWVERLREVTPPTNPYFL